MSEEDDGFGPKDVAELFQRGAHTEAEEKLRAFLATNPKEPGALAWLGATLAAQERHVEGLEAATLAAEEAPNYVFAHVIRADLLRKVGRPEDALHAAKRAAELDPQDPDLHVSAAEILAEMGLAEEAHAAVRRALVIEDTHPGATNLRLYLEMRHGPASEGHEGDGADELLDSIGSVIERDPDDAEGHALMGQALLAQGEHREARVHLRRALDIDPNLPLARSLMVEALKQRFAPYRWLMGFYAWTREAGGLVTLAVLIGGYLLFFNLWGLAEEAPSQRVWIIPLIVVYLLFVLLSWIGDAVFEAAVWLHPDGRRALPPASRQRALALVSLIGLASLAAGLGLAGIVPAGLLVAIMLVMTTLPVTQAFVPGYEEEVAPKFIALAFLAAVAAFVVLMVTRQDGLAHLVQQVHMWGFVAYIWLRNLTGVFSSGRG